MESDIFNAEQEFNVLMAKLSDPSQGEFVTNLLSDLYDLSIEVQRAFDENYAPKSENLFENILDKFEQEGDSRKKEDAFKNFRNKMGIYIEDNEVVHSRYNDFVSEFFNKYFTGRRVLENNFFTFVDNSKEVVNLFLFLDTITEKVFLDHANESFHSGLSTIYELYKNKTLYSMNLRALLNHQMREDAYSSAMNMLTKVLRKDLKKEPRKKLNAVRESITEKRRAYHDSWSQLNNLKTDLEIKITGLEGELGDNTFLLDLREYAEQVYKNIATKTDESEKEVHDALKIIIKNHDLPQKDLTRMLFEINTNSEFINALKFITTFFSYKALEPWNVFTGFKHRSGFKHHPGFYGNPQQAFDILYQNEKYVFNQLLNPLRIKLEDIVKTEKLQVADYTKGYS